LSNAGGADAEFSETLRKFARRSETKNNLQAMVDLASSQEGVAVTPGEFDANPFLLNCLNGTLDLRTGELKRHNRSDLIMKLAPVEYDRQARCPTWLKFLDRILGGDQNLIQFVQKVFGYALTGDVTEKAFFVFHGEGNNGKTTLLETVRRMMGDYAGVMDVDVLMQKSTDAAKERAHADLVGKRFVTCSETDQGQRLHEARIKLMTGMGKLQGRKIYGSPFEFDPAFKLFMDANHKPEIRGTDNAIWSRVRLVPFNVSIPKEERDKNLGNKLKAELPGILAWAVEGCLRWREEGLGEPAAVASAVEQYRQEMDLVADFLTDCCVLGGEFRESFTALYDAFVAWCETLGEAPMSQRAFATNLDGKGFALSRTASERFRMGLKLSGEQTKMIHPVQPTKPPAPNDGFKAA
jgi:putative DNA primase/helicase